MKHSYTGRYTVLIRFMHLLLCSQARNYVKGVYTPAMHVQLIRFIIQRSQHNTVSYEYNNYIIGCSYTPTLHLIYSDSSYKEWMRIRVHGTACVLTSDFSS